MKATKLLLLATLFAGFASLSYAGPSPEYWARIKTIEKEHAQAKAQAAVQVKADAQAKAKSATQVAVCATTCSCPDMKKS